MRLRDAVLRFIGIGAMFDFGPLLSNPKLILFGAAPCSASSIHHPCALWGFSLRRRFHRLHRGGGWSDGIWSARCCSALRRPDRRGGLRTWFGAVHPADGHQTGDDEE
jgi:hypothetical protein